MSLRNDTDFFLFVAFRPDHIYKYISGVAKDLLSRVFGASTLQTLLGDPVLACAFFRVRDVPAPSFRALRSRPELASATGRRCPQNPYTSDRNIDIYR